MSRLRSRQRAACPPMSSSSGEAASESRSMSGLFLHKGLVIVGLACVTVSCRATSSPILAYTVRQWRFALSLALLVSESPAHGFSLRHGRLLTPALSLSWKLYPHSLRLRASARRSLLSRCREQPSTRSHRHLSGGRRSLFESCARHLVRPSSDERSF